VTGSAAFGALVTVLTGSEPGSVLGVLLVAGTAAAALAVKPRAVYVIIPVPALAYVAAATMAGLVHDRATDTSTAALAVSAAQWVASGFLAMTAATVLAILVTAARWLSTRRRSRGPGYPAPAARADGPRRTQAGRSPSAPRRPERDADYLASRVSRAAR
jgi:hypothetical protein